MSSMQQVLIDVVMLYLKYQQVPLNQWSDMIKSRLKVTINARSHWQTRRDKILPKNVTQVRRGHFIDFFNKQKLEQHQINQIRLNISVEEEEAIKIVRALQHSCKFTNCPTDQTELGATARPGSRSRRQYCKKRGGG
jgi:hypothetical protein